jgi:hypothetical protein
MKRRRWDSKTKTKIILEGLSGRPVSEICNEYIRTNTTLGGISSYQKPIEHLNLKETMEK